MELSAASTRLAWYAPALAESAPCSLNTSALPRAPTGSPCSGAAYFIKLRCTWSNVDARRCFRRFSRYCSISSKTRTPWRAAPLARAGSLPIANWVRCPLAASRAASGAITFASPIPIRRVRPCLSRYCRSHTRFPEAYVRTASPVTVASQSQHSAAPALGTSPATCRFVIAIRLSVAPRALDFELAGSKLEAASS